MSEIKLFNLTNGQADEISGKSEALEKTLQNLFEQNLDTLLGVRFLASEHSTGSAHGGRIDSLGIDENGCPVILEYKRSKSENVINQGLYYLDWLMDHKAEFKLLVLEKLGGEHAENIDWSGPRLICVASDYTKFDEHAILQINRNIDLVRYKRFGDELLALELATTASAPKQSSGNTRSSGPTRSVSRDGMIDAPDLTVQIVPQLLPILCEVREFFQGLGDDVTEGAKGHYFTYRRLKNFCYMDVRQTKLNLKLKLNPSGVTLRDGFTRDMQNSGAWNGETVEVLIEDEASLREALPLIQQSYEGM